MTTIGFMAPAIALTGISFIGCNSVMAVVLLCFAVMLEGTGYAGKVDIPEHFNSRLFNHGFFNQELFNPKAKQNHLTMSFSKLIFFKPRTLQSWNLRLKLWG